MFASLLVLATSRTQTVSGSYFQFDVNKTDEDRIPEISINYSLMSFRIY